MATPEGKTKEKVKELLDKYESRIYREMNVPGGYGKSSLDFVGCANGWFFAVETKAWLSRLGPTPRQEGTIEDMEAAGARTFVVNDAASLEELDAWLAEIMV